MGRLAHDLTWMDFALCREHLPELWFEQVPAIALAICHTCTVQIACLEHAMKAEGSIAEAMRFGVYAGTTPRERYLLFRARAKRRLSA